MLNKKDERIRLVDANAKVGDIYFHGKEMAKMALLELENIILYESDMDKGEYKNVKNS